jgi:hypothetical protein
MDKQLRLLLRDNYWPRPRSKEQAGVVIVTGVPLPLGPRALEQCFWFKRLG